MFGLASLGRSSLVAFLASNPSAPTIGRCSTQGIKSFTTRTKPLAVTQFLLHYEYIPEVLEKRPPHREEHLKLAKDMVADGTCLSGGPTGPVSMEVPTGALFVFTNAEAAQDFVEKDPYVEHGIVTSHSIQEWNAAIQKE
jgi:uncharacterized protein YciI